MLLYNNNNNICKELFVSDNKLTTCTILYNSQLLNNNGKHTYMHRKNIYQSCKTAPCRIPF